MTNTYFFDKNTSGKFTVAISGFQSKYNELIVNKGQADKTSTDISNIQTKLSVGYTFNKKLSPENQLTFGLLSDINFLNLHELYIPNGDSVLRQLTGANTTTTLIKGFVNLNHRFSNMLFTNFGLYLQTLSLNGSTSIEPRWNIKYQFQPNQSISFGAGLHSQMQPLPVYFYQYRNALGQVQLTNKDLDFVKSIHTVAGYDISFPNHLRIKTEVYAQYIFNAAVETIASSFSMLNAGSGFGFPDKSWLQNKGKGKNYGVELTVEKFLHKGFYYLFTGSLFQSTYSGSDNIWRSTAFDSRYVANFLGGKEFRLNKKSSFGIDTKFIVAGGQRYTPFDIAASKASNSVVYQDNIAYSLKNNDYMRWDIKFSYTSNGKKTTQKWFIDFQNFTNRKNIYLRTLNVKTRAVSEIDQMGFFPNINYQITF